MAEQKKSKAKTAVKIIVWLILAAAAAAIFVFADELFGTDNIFEKLIADNNVENYALVWLIHALPKLIKSFQIIVVCLIAYNVIVWILTKCFSRNNHVLTVIKLLASFCKYLLAIVAILVILASWGVNTTALLASAGIFALVISLGAQSLIADIIAGIFIVFDGSYRVGDIIVIDDWRGTVTEIGIRTTKIIDAGGNVKIVNNSSIVSVINQTKELSLAKCQMSISYEEPLEHVEVVISENLDKIKEKIKGIVEGPYYKGVTELADSSIELLFFATCKEDDLYQVQRDMNREFLLLFEKNNILIPYPQIVVNPPDQVTPKNTAQSESKAADFIEEQKQASAGLEENNNG